ncbi:MAG TPA: radical SAM protein [Steroidobacteraceae bacterium]|nr:radical SAM protein [Steroidobacteraceae bacterium]
MFAAQLDRLPLVTLYLTERCNSRCVTCDYWRHGRADMSLDKVRRLVPSLRNLHTRVALLSGGEPLLNPEWPSIAQVLREAGLKLWLLTSGLSLVKHARHACELFDAITVSLDGTDRQTYQAIRGLDAFDNVCDGIEAVAEHGVAAGLRVTVQRSNFRQLPAFVSLAKELRARQVSFLAVDVANPHAFGRTDDFGGDLALSRADLRVFDEVLRMMERERAEDFRSQFIAESPEKLRRILQYFAGIQGAGEYPAVRCNAPEFSAVIGATGKVQPCFFISGPAEATLYGDGAGIGDLAGALNDERMVALRRSIHGGARAECKTCVCSMWRDTNNPDSLQLT